MKAWSVIKTILSGFIWGLGQLFNKQYLKSLFFFTFFAIFVSIELLTSNYFFQETYDNQIAMDKITGESMGEWYSKRFFSTYDNEALNKGNDHPEFEAFLTEIGVTKGNNGNYYGGPTGVLNPTASLFTEDKFIEFFAQDILKASYLRYTNLATQGETLAEDFDLENAVNLVTKENLFWDDVNDKFYFERNTTDVNGSPKKEYVETGWLHRLDNPSVIQSNVGLKTFNKTGSIYTYNGNYYVGVTTNGINQFLRLSSSNFELLSAGPGVSFTSQSLIIGPIYELTGSIYEYYEPALLYNGIRQQYKQTAFSKYFRLALVQGHLNNPVKPADLKRLMIRVYFEMHPDLKEAYLSQFDNFFYDRAGMFLKGYWEVITLGQTKEFAINDHLSLVDVMVGRVGEANESTMRGKISYDGTVNVRGHVSTLLLIDGLIAVILSLFFFIFGIWSMIDTWRVSEQKRLEHQVLNTKQYFKSVWDNGFEYIILSPAMFVLGFISIMPILFGFIIAFTSIKGTGSMDNLFDWVGFENFIAIFNPNTSIGSGFSIAFWRVLGWTLVWAVMSTLTVFFGGFFQALILNSESVVFRKLWRTILILPWAIPALLSQMVFSVIFNENGLVNQIFQTMGFYELFKDWGILGQTFQEATGWAKVFWLGNSNIQWFTNEHNPNFVRATLIIVNIWLGFPYFMALMTGIMTAIDKSLYEAADIDGATGWQKLVHITMPLVLYSTAPILIMTFSGNFNNFGVIYFITGGKPGDLTDPNRGYAGDTDILISWMYRLTTDPNIALYNMASVFSVLIFLLVGSITAWNLSRTRAFAED